jgi:hypothetical protein
LDLVESPVVVVIHEALKSSARAWWTLQISATRPISKSLFREFGGYWLGKETNSGIDISGVVVKNRCR